MFEIIIKEFNKKVVKVRGETIEEVTININKFINECYLNITELNDVIENIIKDLGGK